MGEKQEEKMVEICCISHQFFKTASENPKKIAAVYASGGAKIIKRRRAEGRVCGGLWEEFAEKRSSALPPIYEGDRCFTYSEVLVSVESLAARVRRILDGGDDAGVIQPRGGGVGEEGERSGLRNLKSKRLFWEGEDHCIPKIVGIYMVPSIEYVVSVLAVLRCGEAFVPLDPLWPKKRILSINVDLIIGCCEVLDRNIDYQVHAEHWLVKCGCAPVLCVSNTDRARDPVDLSCFPWPCEGKKQRAFCYVLYTSGSTGQPKGVCGTEIGLLNRFLWMQDSYPLSTNEVLLFKTSVSFIDHLQEILAPILTATTMIIPPLSIMKENLFHLVDLLQVYQISRLVCVPTLIKLFLPALLESQVDVARCLRMLILSGETFPLSLWESLYKILPASTILNLYGSTEVSGDCTYFDCKKLPEIMKTENMSSVPIGQPLPNCQVILEGPIDISKKGEICVGGYCISCGYIWDSNIIDLDLVRLTEDSTKYGVTKGHESNYYFRTGDFARRLESNDLIFEGRKDRMVKVNGIRISLEEIENTLRGHPNVIDAAVIFTEGSKKVAMLETHLVMKQQSSSDAISQASLRHWMSDKLALEMIPNIIHFRKSFPLTSTGKVDYALLVMLKDHVQTVDLQASHLLQNIQKAFCTALMIDQVSTDDDFFFMGGASTAAAHAAHLLGIDMRLLYMYPTPNKLHLALLNKEENCLAEVIEGVNWELKQKSEIQNLPLTALNETGHSHTLKRKAMPVLEKTSEIHSVNSKCMQSHVNPKDIELQHEQPWAFIPKLVPCSLSRCNKTMYEKNTVGDAAKQFPSIKEIPKGIEGSIRRLWKVDMESCVDASPTIVCKNENIYLFIGSHSHNFSCINAKSGFVEWNVKLNGRTECSAAVVGDFSQVVVGCYDGKLYFLDFLTGALCWTFQTGAEVKSQPVVDKKRGLVWCGSHDHYLYALDYEDHICIHMHPCGGSVLGSPAIDEALDVIYAGSTNGYIFSISIKAPPYSTLWQHELGAPIFGSLNITSDGYVICCLVDGEVVALDSTGRLIWKFKSGGPLFAGPSISRVLPSQVLVCCRDGNIYSLKQETGYLLWYYNIGDPITASAYVDESLQMVSNSSLEAVRLICVCSSTGIIQLLRVSPNVEMAAQSPKLVYDYARTLLDGSIFSSPIMVAGRIFVGCRDNYLHCLAITQNSLLESK